jgi:Zn finger protein HypA/HybF involved in hydrogenase expression
MEILLTGLGLSPLFAVRPLLTLVLGGIMLRMLQYTQQDKALTTQHVLLGLGALVLAVVGEPLVKTARGMVEELADHIQNVLNIVQRILATLMGTAFTALMLGYWGQHLVQDLFADAGTLRSSALLPALAGLSTGSVILGAVGLSIWGFDCIRVRISASLAFFPWSVEPNVDRVYGVLEMALCVLGVFAAMVWPFLGGVTFVVCASVGGTTFLLLRDFEERQRTACAACGLKVHRCALYCPSCSAERVPVRLGLLGRALGKKAEDLVVHRLQLLGARRCPRCAEPLSVQAHSAACPRCATPAFADSAEREQFVRYADKRWLALVPVLAMLGVVPLLGAILGLWLYQVSPAGALGAFARWQDRAGSQVLRRLGFLALAVFQPIPMVGAVVVPLWVGLLHAQSRRAVRAAPKAVAQVGASEAPALSAVG